MAILTLTQNDEGLTSRFKVEVAAEETPAAPEEVSEEAPAAEAEAEVSLLRCDSDLALALFRNSLEGIVTGGGDFLALCVPVAGEAAVAACSSVDLGLASRSSLEVETALLPAVLLRCCGLRLFGWYCRPADSGAVGMRSVLRLCALAVRGVAKPPSVPSFPSPVQIIQNNAVREKERDAGL